jgi:hypothetical protein
MSSGEARINPRMPLAYSTGAYYSDGPIVCLGGRQRLLTLSLALLRRNNLVNTTLLVVPDGDNVEPAILVRRLTEQPFLKPSGTY